MDIGTMLAAAAALFMLGGKKSSTSGGGGGGSSGGGAMDPEGTIGRTTTVAGIKTSGPSGVKVDAGGLAQPLEDVVKEGEKFIKSDAGKVITGGAGAAVPGVPAAVASTVSTVSTAFIGAFGPGAVASVGAGIAGVGISAGLVAASGALGFKLTGDAWGAVGGGVGFITNPTAGVAGAQLGNVGRLLGREIDVLLGGDGRTGTGIVNQVTGYMAALALGALGLSALPGIGILFLAVAGIASAISDSAKLAYGQRGVVQDTWAELAQYWNANLPPMEEAVRLAYCRTTLQPTELLRVTLACAFQCQGYIEQMNTIRERAWMGRQAGIGVSRDQHRNYGLDRGYFVDTTVYPATTQRVGGVVIQVPMSCNWYDVKNVLYELVGGGDRWRGAQAMAAHYADNASADARLYAKGQMFANMNAYLAFLRIPWGALVFDQATHARYGRDVAKAFEGDIDAQGNLSAFGYTIFWEKAFNNDPSFFVENNPPALSAAEQALLADMAAECAAVQGAASAGSPEGTTEPTTIRTKASR